MRHPERSSTSPLGEQALGHVRFLSETVGPRVAGSSQELQAAAYAFSELRQAGLSPEIRPFDYMRALEDDTEVSVRSQNVVALKPGESAQEIIVIAHVDSVAKGRGADDNASGVGVLLEAAERVEALKLPYSVRFIVAGAEEEGLQGARVYAQGMTAAEVANTRMVINLDSLLAGDFMYVYGEGPQGVASREALLSWAKANGRALITQAGLNPEYPAGTTGDWSDHAPFKDKGISYTYLDATNWTLGDLDGYTQTEKHGGVWHTENDTLAFLEREFPGRVQEHLSLFSSALVELLTNVPEPAAGLESQSVRPVRSGDFEKRHRH